MQHGAAERKPRLELDPRKFLIGWTSGQSRLQLTSGAIIWNQGDAAQELFFIEKGWVKVSAVSSNGKEALLGLTGEGEFMGARCFIEDYRRFGTARALGRCSLVRISRPAAIQLLVRQPDFAVALVASLARQGCHAQEILMDQLTDTTERRLASMLLRLSADRRHERKKSQPILMRLSQADLASMIGTTRTHISHFMNGFRRQGFIDYNRSGYVTVHKQLTKVLQSP